MFGKGQQRTFEHLVSLVLMASLAMASPTSAVPQASALRPLPPQAGISQPPASLELSLTVSGRITDTGGNPLSGIRVEAAWPGGYGDIHTGADGAYFFGGVTPGGEVQMWVNAPVERRLAFRHWWTLNATADIRKDFTLVPGHLFAGRVAMPDGSPPPTEVGLSARPVTWTLPQGESVDTSAYGPQAAFRAVWAPGVYTVQYHSLPSGTYGPIDLLDLRAADKTDFVVQLSGQPIPIHNYAPPLAQRIHVGAADDAGMATVSADAGAVPGLFTVLLANLDTSLWTTTLAEADGRFSARLFAPPGSTLMVKYVRDPLWLGSFAHELTPLPTTLVRVPLPAGTQDASGATRFATAGRCLLPPNKSDARWWLSGQLTTPRDLNVRPGETVRISGTLRIASSGLGSGYNPATLRVNCNVALSPFFDANGRQLESMEHNFEDNQFMSTLFTPTGLPIERDSEDPAPFLLGREIGGWRTVRTGVLEAPLTLDLALPANLAAGMYAPRIAIHAPTLPYSTTWYPDLWVLDRNVNEGYLPLLKVGSPQTPRLVAHLLTNVYAGGARGARAREDRERFDLVTMVVYQPQHCIVPRVDRLSGRTRAYSLEPSLPMLSYTDRGFPVVPLVPLVFPTQPLQVIVQKPDGTRVTLGPAPCQQSFSCLPATLAGDVLHLGAPFLADVYALRNVQDAFRYEFDRYGHHVITVSGTLQDVWGHSYSVGGTYDVYVARELDLDCGQLPTTPYQVGDDFSPVVQVYPRMPAEVEAKLTLLPNSNPALAVVRTARGRANAFGYFSPSAQLSSQGGEGATGAAAFTLTSPGEFRVDVSAVYTDSDGTVWMGSLTWGNVVETPSTPLIVHGRHGIDNAPQTGLQWFLWTSLAEEDRKDHIYYPFQLGDVVWAKESDIPGGDSFIPAITVQDTVGTIRGIVQSRYRLPHSALSQGPAVNDLSTRIANNEIPLFSTASSGVYPDRYPAQIDQWGYSYRSSERPGVRVRELVCEDSNLFGYWRYGDMYGGQIGMGHQGDLPNDFKFQFGGVVFRDLTRGIHQYAIYSAMWVLLPEDDPIGSRVMPPYQGAGGGPQYGGPLMRLAGRDIDVFFLPLGTQPGSILEAGDTFSFSGHVAPPLDSRVTAVVRSPRGAVVRTIEGHANRVGWFYEPSGDFVVTEAGAWTVEVRVVHDRVYPATGMVPASYNTGSLLGAADGRYTFYVVPRGAPRLAITLPAAGFLRWPHGLQPVQVQGHVPPEWTNTVVSYTIYTPGFILAQGSLRPTGSTFHFAYDPQAANRDFGVIDVTAPEEWRPGLSDEVLITVLASGSGGHRAASLTLFGEEVLQDRDPSRRPRAYLPVMRTNR